MNGSAMKLLQFMDGTDKEFIVPVYQRNYSWKTENCKQLYDDLIKVIKNERENHFFGSIVSVYNGKDQEFLIIDGQQRLTTISLLLLAMRNLLEKGVVRSDNERLAEKIYKTYLINEWQPQGKRIKLKSVANDAAALDALFKDSAANHFNSSKLTVNYNYFYARIQRGEISIDELYEAILRLIIISITVDPQDKPQLIFESLNSTGVALEEGDKIRNYILMGLNKEQQSIYYNDYWQPIEEYTEDNASFFVRDYLSIKQQVTPNQDKVYPAFKEYVENSDIELQELLEDLLEYARLYGNLIHRNREYSKRLNASLRRLDWLDVTVTDPFLLEVLHMHKHGILKMDEVETIVELVESYLFRRNICDVPTNSLNKVFLTLNREVLRYDGSTENYVDKLKYALSSKKESSRFPGDEEFFEMLANKQVYRMRGAYKTYLFERFENYKTRESKDVFDLLEDGTYSIEHIMPQHLTPAWIDSLGSEHKEIHETWLHRIGNLTLTAYNSSYSNATFKEKKDAVDKDGVGIGFSNSGLRINQDIAQKEKWGKEEIIERNNKMCDLAKLIWEYPETNYEPPEKQLDVVSLDDDVTLTGRKIVKYAFKGHEYFADTWTEMYQNIVRTLHEQDNSILQDLVYAADNDMDLAGYFGSSETSFNSSAKIDQGVYAWTGNSTRTKVNALKKLFKLFGEDEQNLLFYLNDAKESEVEDDSDEPMRKVLRRKFWEYALPIITEASTDLRIFDNVTPTSSSWKTGSFGIGGFGCVVIANYGSAKVQLYFGKRDISKNKQAFDYLFSRKQEIEQKVGAELDWIRADDRRYSAIEITLKDVSISSEADWTRMAEFLATWSSKICSVILPYLRELYPGVRLSD